MRSPWQLLKGLVSRGKSDEANATTDEAVSMPDPRVESSGSRNAPQREIERPRTNPPATADGNETDRQSTSIGADTQQPLPAVQTDPETSQQVADNGAPEGHGQPTSVAPAVETIDGEGLAGTVTTGSNDRRAKVARAREDLGKRTVVKTTIEPPVTAKKTAVDAADELDLEIKNLRLQLSAKLLEQNKQLRRMIERYGDK